MTDLELSGRAGPDRPKWSLNRLIASPTFQRRMACIPLIRGLVRRDGEEIFDLVAGFCHSQMLHALVKFEVLDHLLKGPRTAAELALFCQAPEPRVRIMMDAAVALGLVRKKKERYRIARKGAAIVGVPGLKGMIAHHDVLYRDLADPVAFLRGETEPELAQFWPYVFGADGASDPETAATYSKLMTDSQSLVADETLLMISLSGLEHLMDIGGGTGAFLAAAAKVNPTMALTLFDLPAVVPAAKDLAAELGTTDRLTIVPGSFRDDPLPHGADMISLVRVLYDHADETVAALLSKVIDTLPAGGRILISEPMAGGDTPQRAGDAYFAFYCLAMNTGKARSADEIASLLSQAGFEAIQMPRSRRPFVTSVVTAVKPA